MQFINESTLEPINSLWKTLAVYYSVAKRDNKQCIQKKMDFVEGHTTPSSEGAKSSRFKNKDIKCFYHLGKQVFLLVSI